METVSMTPWISVISLLIGWTFFIIVLSMFKSFISHGFSIAIAEFLLKNCTSEQREKIVRWFGNGEIILEHLKELEEVINKEK